MNRLIAATLMTLAFAGTGSAFAAGETGVDGYWQSEDGQGVVLVAACATDATAKCGKIVSLKKPVDADGKPLTDGNNPDAALKKRPICGLEVITGMKSGANGFVGGSLYDPEEGKIYQGSMILDGAVLKVTGSLDVPLIGKVTETETWTRVAAPAAACK